MLRENSSRGTTYINMTVQLFTWSFDNYWDYNKQHLHDKLQAGNTEQLPYNILNLTYTESHTPRHENMLRKELRQSSRSALKLR